MAQAMPVRRMRRALLELAPRGACLIWPRGSKVAGAYPPRASRPSLILTTAEAQGLMSSGAIARVRSSEATHLITEAGRATLRRLTARVTWPDAPSAYAAAHALLQWRHVDTPGGKRGERERRAVNMGESVIGWLSSRGHISAAELEAGEALRRDFERAQLGPRVTQNWEGFLTAGVDGGRSGFTPSEAAEAARARLFSAFVVLGSDLADVALRAICFGEGLEAVEREMGWSARSGKIVLKIALRRLVEFYQIREGA